MTLKKILDDINFSYEEKFIYNFKIDYIKLVKETNTFLIYLIGNNVSDYEIMSRLFSNKNKIDNKYNVEFNVKYENVINDDIVIYTRKILDKLVVKKPSLVSLNDSKIIVDDDIISIEIDNSIFQTFKSEIKKIEKELELLGLNGYVVTTVLSFVTSQNVKKEIAEEQNEEIEFNTFNTFTPKRKAVKFVKDKANFININEIHNEINNVYIEGYIFNVEAVERKGKKGSVFIVNLKVSDKDTSIFVKKVMFDETEFLEESKKYKNENWYRFYGNVINDEYLHDYVLDLKDSEKLESKEVVIVDDAKEKRVELHLHTMMSMMDGVIAVDPDLKVKNNLVDFVTSLGHSAFAVTDHNVVQAFPYIFNKVKGINKDREEKIKPIYGSELNVVETEANIIYNSENLNLLDTEFVVFDTETTGFKANIDQMIEIGAVKMKNGEIIDRFDELISCPTKLPEKIVALTNITDEMLKDCDTEENVTKRFLEFVGKDPLIAHNASFDISFISAAMEKYNLGEFNYPVIDTMALARTMYPDWPNHKLSTLVKRLNVSWDESAHHRADYDSEGTGACYYKMAKELSNQNVEWVDDLSKIIDKESIIKFARPKHLTVLVKNKVGLKNLFKIISIANTTYLFKGKEPKIPKEELLSYREGLLIGSGCVNGELFLNGINKDEEELASLMSVYDYIEVCPLSCASYLLEGDDRLFKNALDYNEYVKKIVRVARESGKIVCAVGDVHHLRDEDLIYRRIIADQRTNGKIHVLNRPNVNIPNAKFLTTNEMLSAFSFLDKDVAYEIVVTNTNKIANMIEEQEIIKDKLYTPVLDNSAEITKEMVYKTAHEMYGEELPKIVEERLATELHGIIGGGFDVIYLIAEKLVKKSNEDGYFVGSRGSVGSSLVATMMGITEVNGLPAHYLCPKCKKSIWEDEIGPFNLRYPSGYDLPDKVCECGEKLKKEGQDMPFATFLGFNADKVPDIDLNFSGDNQSDAHNYTKVLFGEKNVYRAGTISTVAEKTAYGMVKKYCEDFHLTLKSLDIERLAKGCTGVKRTTGQHPGGIIVIPQYMDVYDFTAYQYPADEPDSTWYTSHFDFHAIHDNVLKLDILGHDDPTMLRYLGDSTKIDIKSIPFDDKNVLSLFLSSEALKCEKDIMCPTGTLGIPEFGTNFVINMLVETKPQTFAELVKISGLSHGTDVWQGNVRDIVMNNIAPFKDAIGCRDDILISLINYGMEAGTAFKISEFVRKGKAKKEPDKWAGFVTEMNKENVPEWFIECCHKIQYMFPKAHATAYVMMGFRVAYFKVYYPLHYYSAFFSIRKTDFHVESMLGGYDKIKEQILELKNKGFEKTNKEDAVVDTLAVALEMTARGYTFKNIDIKVSLAKTFVIDEENKALIIPFMAVDGLGEAVAYKIVEERDKKPFYSIEDFQNRGKVNVTTIDKLRVLGVFEGMPESSQLSLF